MSASGQFIRYSIVGIVSNAAAYFAFLLLIYLGIEAKIAMTYVYLVAASVGFWVNRRWTFAHDGHWMGSAARYAFAQAAGYVLNLEILMFFRDHLHFAAELVQVCAIPLVALFLFVMSKFLIFRPSNESR